MVKTYGQYGKWGTTTETKIWHHVSNQARIKLYTTFPTTSVRPTGFPALMNFVLRCFPIKLTISSYSATEFSNVVDGGLVGEWCSNGCGESLLHVVGCTMDVFRVGIFPGVGISMPVGLVEPPVSSTATNRASCCFDGTELGGTGFWATTGNFKPFALAIL